jgi:hypothetical protein
MDIGILKVTKMDHLKILRGNLIQGEIMCPA